MRSVDRPVPTIDVHRPAVEPWPAVLHIGIERQPLPVYVWDDASAVWDDPLVRYTWDDTDTFGYDRMDVWCKFHGLTITAGNPDAEGIMESGHLEMTLDNRDGTLSQYDAAGRLIDWQPGSPIDIWAVYAGEAYWLFSGSVTVWRENGDGTLDVEAFDAFTRLNRFMAEWTPGAAGQTVAQRLTAICATAGYTGPTRFAAGDVTLLTEATTQSALEAMQQAARSDGGLLGVDADGTLVYSPRTWMAGRADQETVFELSDNYCVEGITTVWDATQTTTDDDLVNTIAAANIADVAVTATNAATIDRYGLMPWPSSRTDDLWADAGQGQTLVDWIVATRGQHYLRVDEASIYAHDTRRNLWPIVLDLRLGDRVDWYHEQPAVDGPALFAVAVIVSTITHEITPAEWVTTFATSRAVGVKPAGRWDVTTLTWDDTDPLNVWL